MPKCIVLLKLLSRFVFDQEVFVGSSLIDFQVKMWHCFVSLFLEMKFQSAWLVDQTAVMVG